LPCHRHRSPEFLARDKRAVAIGRGGQGRHRRPQLRERSESERVGMSAQRPFTAVHATAIVHGNSENSGEQWWWLGAPKERRAASAPCWPTASTDHRAKRACRRAAASGIGFAVAVTPGDGQAKRGRGCRHDFPASGKAAWWMPRQWQSRSDQGLCPRPEGRPVGHSPMPQHLHLALH
jgi:hypothetical protein